MIKQEEHSLACKQLFVTTNKILQPNEPIYPNGFSSRDTNSRLNMCVDTHRNSPKRDVRQTFTIKWSFIDLLLHFIIDPTHLPRSEFCSEFCFIDLLCNLGYYICTPATATAGGVKFPSVPFLLSLLPLLSLLRSVILFFIAFFMSLNRQQLEAFIFPSVPFSWGW